MSNLEFMLNLPEVDKILELISLFFISIFTFYTFIKIINEKDIKISKKIIMILCLPLISLIALKVKYKVDSYFCIIILISLISAMNVILLKKDILYSFAITVISLGINYVLYVTSIVIAFFPTSIFMIKNDFISLCIILCVYCILIYKLFKIKRLKHGIIFLQTKTENSYFNILILNVCIIILFLDVIIQTVPFLEVTKTGTMMLILSIYMFIEVKQSFQLYYKQKQLIKDLEQTKEELDEKTKEIEKLEKENLEFSKTSHSLHHKQKVLEHKLDKIIKLNENGTIKEEELKEDLNNIAKEMYIEPSEVELPKTEIEKVDDMLEYMQAECIKNNIKFEVQVAGNIHYMVNHLITENELEILLADHIKDAIIAINHSTNSNRSILVRLGKIDEIYSLYIYDSGIKFTKEVLEKLGKEPITTYKESGGTGMGFMNTFDVINKYNASLIIDEIGDESSDNYTKIVKIRFDNKKIINLGEGI